MQPKLAAKARCTDKEVGKISKVIVDPLSHEISHVVVRELNGQGVDRQVPIEQIQTVVSEEEIVLRCSSEEFERFPQLERDQYVTIHDVEIAHLEDHLHVEPGEVLVPLPRLEQGVPRRAFFNNMTHAIGTLIALPLAFHDGLNYSVYKLRIALRSIPTPTTDNAATARQNGRNTATLRSRQIPTATASAPTSSNPPMTPSQVLPGLIAGASLTRPKPLPAKYAPASAAQTINSVKIR